MPLRRCFVLALLLLPIPAFAAGPAEQAAKRFASLKATILSERGGEVLIDAGSAAGVLPLDLFAVAGTGTPVVHPQTGAVLGEVTETKAVLQITWVKDNFSGAKRLRGSAQLNSGDKATRYADLAARFIDCASDAESLSTELRSQLPQLRWGSYQTADDCTSAMKQMTDADLFFLAGAGELSVRDATGNLLQRFVREAAPQPVRPAAAATGMPAFERWYGGDWKGAPAAVAAGDFDGDKQIEVVVAGTRRVSLGRSVQRTWQELGSVELPVTHQVLAVEACDVDGNGNAEVCVSAARDNALSSSVYLWRDGKLVELQKGLPWLLRVLEENGKQVLYGQELENGHWSGPIRRLDWDGRQLVPGALLSLPAGTGLRGLAQITVDSKPALLRLNRNDTMEVFDAQGESLWQSETPYGGSENFLEVAGDVSLGREHNTRNLYVQQRLQVISTDQVLVPINIGSRAFNRMISYDESQVQLVRWDGRALRVVWELPKEKGYLADCTWADVDNDGKAELLMLMAYSKEGVFSKGRYSLVVLEM